MSDFHNARSGRTSDRATHEASTSGAHAWRRGHDRSGRWLRRSRPTTRRSGALRLCVCAWCVIALSPAFAGQLLDRVVARVGSVIITLTDVRAALGLGLIETRAGEDPERAAIERLIDRQLLLNEVARFPPPEPDPQAVDAQVTLMTQYAGSDLQRLMETTGLDERSIRALARDSLRIQAYLDQRFGAAFQVSDEEVRRYYDANPTEFMRDGLLVPFEQVEVIARQRAAAARRAVVVGQWLRDLRARTQVVEVPLRNG